MLAVAAPLVSPYCMTDPLASQLDPRRDDNHCIERPAKRSRMLACWSHADLLAPLLDGCALYCKDFLQFYINVEFM